MAHGVNGVGFPVRPAALLGLLLASCATTNAPPMAKASKPAEIDLSQYQTLAIAEMRGSDAATTVSALLEDRLLQGKRFQIVDRQRIQAAMNELRLASGDLADPKKAVQLGRLVTAGALISGIVTERYQETPRQSWFSTRAGARHAHHWTEARLILGATFRVTDVSTGKLLVVKEMQASRSSASFAGSPVGPPVGSPVGSLLGTTVGSALDLDHDVYDPPPDRGRMETEAREEVVDRFVAALF
jgi:curli biogenesis system outer membrane secretion channel CsgG